ncbi:MAG: type II toxin-antitoxin system VapC family toxin [Candidatus Methanoperedens sp.]|nr:type II toxin-antitoxin system VapC family toxin [Candidatus Methanoperedens sp.]MCE8428450.1 type II toxin-antitoxin system VapC family toxin [Candidatus Methanoperedens sp.]
MGIVIIDTDILIDLLRDKEYAVSKIRYLEKDEELATTDINAFELYFGAYNSRDKASNIASTKGLLKTLTLLHSKEDSMETAGRIFAERRAKGKMIEIRDLLIASIALHNGCKLLTNNRGHFEGIEGLILQD